MKTNVLIFIIGFILAFGGGYLFWGMNDSDEQINTDSTTPAETAENAEETEESEATDETDAGGDTVATEAEPLVQNNCLSCHAVESLNASGGTTGPDLSNAYNDVEGKHGKPLDEFLKEPTSAVMSTVIEGDPLTDEERESIVEALKLAAEQD